jgi:hypothetical protein
MDFTLQELGVPGPGRGVALTPDVDVRRYLVWYMQRQAQGPSRPRIAPNTVGAKAQ